MSPIELSAAELFDAFPEPVLLLRDGLVRYHNPSAQRLFPDLGEDTPMPGPLADALPEPHGPAAASFRLDGATCRLRSQDTDQGLFLFLAPEAPDSPPLRLDRLTLRLRQETAGLSAALQRLDAIPPDGARAKQYLSVANQRLYRLLRLCDHLEFLDKPDSGIFHPAPMDLAGCLNELSLQLEDVCGMAGRRFRWASDLSSLLTVGDAALLRRLVLSLVSNALKAAGADSPITLKLSKDRGRAVLTVSDSGPGMDADSLSRLFGGEAVSPPGLSPEEGLGLGLDAVRRIAALHGGTVLVESRPGEGLRAVVSLPIRPLEPDMTLRTPKLDYTGGFSPLLVELSDVLPTALYSPEDLD